jgi:hypothetical protein
MPFLGKNPTSGFSTIVKDDLTPDGSTTDFTLSKNVASANDIAVFVGNVRQEPTDAYSVSGTTLTMTAAPASGINFYVLHIAGTLESSVVPADNTISTGALPALDGSALTGIATPIVAGDVLQYISTQAQTYSGTTISWDSGNIVETTAYSSASLTPLKTLTITAKRANSKFVIDLIGKAAINTGYRSQIALQDTYTPGAYTTSNNLYYSHYGLWNSTGGETYHGLSYRVDDPRSLAAGASRTYYWFGGSISGGTQQYWNLNMSITEVAT